MFGYLILVITLSSPTLSCLSPSFAGEYVGPCWRTTGTLADETSGKGDQGASAGKGAEATTIPNADDHRAFYDNLATDTR
ncbi:hypothetical protein GGR52DRAFT_531408 [Hypoxylon sp. FL1284]|nr:hypothetical protein GGR52DRAFT_531408 [Hypoxylon sp. FL1284]